MINNQRKSSNHQKKAAAKQQSWIVVCSLLIVFLVSFGLTMLAIQGNSKEQTDKQVEINQ